MPAACYSHSHMQLLLLLPPAAAAFDMWMRFKLLGTTSAGTLSADYITGSMCPNIINALKSAAAGASGLSPVFKVPAWIGNPAGASCTLTDAAAQVKCICAAMQTYLDGNGWWEFNVMWSDKLGVKVAHYASLVNKVFLKAAKLPCGPSGPHDSVTIASYGICSEAPDPMYWGPDQGSCSFVFSDVSGYFLKGSGVCVEKFA